MNIRIVNVWIYKMFSSIKIFNKYIEFIPAGTLGCEMLGCESLLPAWASRQPEGESTLMEAGSLQDPLGFQLWDIQCGIQFRTGASFLMTCWEVDLLRENVIQRTQDMVATNQLFPQCFFINVDSYKVNERHNFPWTWSGVWVKHVSWNWLLELLLCIGFFIDDHT